MAFGFLRSRSTERTVQRLHAGLVVVVRDPVFYRDFGVADTFEGRFEMLALVSSLVVMRLCAAPAPAPALAQELTDRLFQGLDDDMREMGVGDLAVPKKIKKLAASLLGRRSAYAGALEGRDETTLREALARNVFGGARAPDDPGVTSLARWTTGAHISLAAQENAALVAGVISIAGSSPASAGGERG